MDIVCCYDYGVYPVGAKFKEKTEIPVIWQMNDLPVHKINFNNWKNIIKLFLSPMRGEIFFRLKYIGYIKKIDKIVVIDYLNKNKLKDNLQLESIVARNGLNIENFKFNNRAFHSNKLKIMPNAILVSPKSPEKIASV